MQKNNTTNKRTESEYQKNWKDIDSPLDFTVDDMEWIDENIKAEASDLQKTESRVNVVKDSNAEKETNKENQYSDNPSVISVASETTDPDPCVLRNDNTPKTRNDISILTKRHARQLIIKATYRTKPSYIAQWLEVIFQSCNTEQRATWTKLSKIYTTRSIKAALNAVLKSYQKSYTPTNPAGLFTYLLKKKGKFRNHKMRGDKNPNLRVASETTNNVNQVERVASETTDEWNVDLIM